VTIPGATATAPPLNLPPASEPPTPPGRKVHTARAELVLARDHAWALRHVPLDPDPLTGIAKCFGQLRPDQSDRIEIILDLQPLTRAAARRRARRALGHHHRKQQGHASKTARFFEGFWNGNGTPAVRPPLERGLRRRGEVRDERELANALLSTDPHFRFQLLIRVQSEERLRAAALLQALLAAFDEFDGDNEFKVAGIRLPTGRYLGADGWWSKGRFDRRIDRWRFGGDTNNIVSSTEIAGLLKPPTAKCLSPHVLRAGVVAPAPRDLPLYDPQRPDDLFPIGVIERDGRQVIAAVPLADTYFSYTPGKSRFGKTESTLVRFVALARAGHGCLFLDPHADALARAKPYLADHADRLVELSIAQQGDTAMQVGWNPFDTRRLTRATLEPRLRMITDGIATALGWNSTAPRAATLLQMATQSLLELSMQLPAELAPTIFQIPTILTNDEWRARVTPLLSQPVKEWWDHTYDRYPPEASTPVTNFIYRMRSVESVAALFGASKSTYDLRAAMDNRQIVLVRLRGMGEVDKLIASFVMFDLLNAAMSRTDVAPDQRSEFHIFADEVQSYDGAVKAQVQALLEQSAKMGIRLHLLNQNPKSLQESTLRAVLTNMSHLFCARIDAASARLVSSNLVGDFDHDILLELPKYEFIGQVTLAGEATTPFRFRGLALDHVFEPANGPDVAGMEQRIAANSGQRPIAETLAALETLHDRIAEHLDTHRTSTANTRPTNDHTGGRARTPLHTRHPLTHAYPHPPPDPTRPDSGEAGEGSGAKVIPLPNF